MRTMRTMVATAWGCFATLALGGACQPDQAGGGDYGAPLESGPVTDDAALPTRSPSRPLDAGAPHPTNDTGMSPSPEEGGAPAGDGSSSSSTSPEASASPCDMSGRWLITQRLVSDALGQTQATRNWLYYEVSQNGTDLTVTKGLHCGYDVVPITSLAGNVDLHAAWPALLANNPFAGQKGTVQASASECQVAFDKVYSVEGVTAPFYLDPAQALPTSSQQASAGTPGWEDWDGDGHPGISLHITGLASGTLYAAVRKWSAWSGTVTDTSGSFILAATWDQEEIVLGYDGSSLLTTQGVRASDPTVHFAEFARLDASEATGDDATICAAVRMLAATLTPTADKK